MVYGDHLRALIPKLKLGENETPCAYRQIFAFVQSHAIRNAEPVQG
jgi:hypothetical protein